MARDPRRASGPSRRDKPKIDDEIDDEIDDRVDDEELVLGDLLNHVLDKGVVISGTVTISVADIDLLVLDLRLLLTSVETSLRRGIERSMQELIPEADGPGREVV
jgi:hypothetical protein